MKKILSILICLVLGISSAWAVDATMTVAINTEVRSTPTASDGVIISNVCEYIEINGELEENCAPAKGGILLTASTEVPADERYYSTSDIKLREKSESFNKEVLNLSSSCQLSSEYILNDNGYVFSHWEVSSGVTMNNNPSSVGKCDFTINLTKGDLFTLGKGSTYEVGSGWIKDKYIKYTVTPKTGVTKTITFTAVWVQPQVTGVDGDHTLTPVITDVNDIRTQDVVFNVANALDKYNFTCNVDGNGFSLSNTKLSADKSTYTSTATYTPTGIHGTHQGSITLTSNHPSSGATTRTSNLTVEENYTPAFTLPETYEVSTLVKPTYVGAFDLVQETDIQPTNMNYAARTSLPKGAAEKINGSEWTVELTENTSGFFSIESLGETQVVKFQPTGTVDANQQFSAKLKVTSTYYDAIGKPQEYTEFVTLLAYAMNDANEHLEIEGESVHDMNLDVIYGTPQQQSVSYVALNLAGTPNASWTSSTDKISYVNLGSLITISTEKDLSLGSHTATLTYTYGALSATLNINASVELATPTLNAYGGLSQITLVWSSVYGADKYIIKSGDNIIAEVAAPATSYVITNLTNGTAQSYTVTAVYTANQTYNKTSNIAQATPNLPTDITGNDYPYIGLFTGTDKYQAGHETYGIFPYRPKRAIDLSAAFVNGEAAFDRLYIFGVTTGNGNPATDITRASEVAGSNASTPCYIYRKVGNNYEYLTTITNVNTPTKPAEFNISVSDEIRSAYFTGYSPYTSCGSTWDENGVFFVSGQGEVDLYFDNLQLYSRPKSTNGSAIVTQQHFSITGLEDVTILGRDDVDGQLIGGVNIKFYTQGTGSAFCFQPIKNGQTFQPTIHLNNENILSSTQGVHLFVNVDFMSVTMDRNATQHSAPIQIIHNKNSIGTATELTIDDNWNSTLTNGILNLATADSRPAPTIDLGYSNTTLNINGGQLFLSNSFNSSDSYDVSYAISYRQKSMMNNLANIYGLGDDQPGGKVRFKDGTINCKPLSQANFESTQGQKLFHNPTSMKCPHDTKIDGGSFNCDVLACSTTTSKGSSPTNSKGQPVCLVTMPIESVAANGTAVLANDWMQKALDLGSNTADLEYYGISSMTPVADKDKDQNPIQVVHLMLPSNKVCFKEVITTPWVACFPSVRVSAGGQSYTLGGDVEVDYAISSGDEGLTIVERTSKLLYGEIDQYIRNLFLGKEVDGQIYEYTAPGGDGLTLTLTNDGLSQEVINTQPYAIYNKVYMLMPLVANQWKMFVPPFDVANVYVIEPYTESNLIKLFDSNSDGKLTNEENNHEIDKARYTQSHRSMDFMYQWLWSIVGMQSNSDIWSNDPNAPATGSPYSYGTFVQEWYNMYNGMEDKPKYDAGIQQLYHYKSNSNSGYPQGMTRWDANFYLYEADGNEWNIGGDAIETQWKEVPTISKKRNIKGDHNVIMKKGGIYLMSFPSTIVNSDMYDYINTWDYWTGKYIILEGYPEEEIDTDGDNEVDDKAQIISGKQLDWNGRAIANTILSTYDVSNKATLRGNSTFAKLDISTKENSYILNNYLRGKDASTDAGDDKGLLDPGSPHNVYVPAQLNADELTPSQGFILANIDAPAGMKPRAINIKTGEITYRDETTTSLPTIGGNKQMMVYNIEGGVGIVPVVEQQVSIYNTAGQVVKSQYLTEETHIALPAGIYLIAGAKEQFKVVVK